MADRPRRDDDRRPSPPSGKGYQGSDRRRDKHPGPQGPHPNQARPGGAAQGRGGPQPRDTRPARPWEAGEQGPASGDRPRYDGPRHDDRPRHDDHRRTPYRAPQPGHGGPGRPGFRPGPRYDSRPARPVDPVLRIAEDEELVAGRRPVEEAFVARREARRLLVVPQRRHALEKLVLHATSLRIPVLEVEGGTLTAVTGFDGHQGIALVVAGRRWATPDDILAAAIERGQDALIVVLDSLEDPQNVGTLLRTAEASGVHGAVFPTHRQAPLTPAAVKASAGAVEHLRLAPVDDLPGALADLHARGLRIVGADGDAPLTAREADLRGPVAIVVGSEGRGLGPAVRRRCDLLVRIPMHGRIESLNASVAGSILLYEAAAQRGPQPSLATEPSDTVTPVDPGEPVEPVAGATGELERDVEDDATAARPAQPSTGSGEPEAPAGEGLEDAHDDGLLPGGPAIPVPSAEVPEPPSEV